MDLIEFWFKHPQIWFDCGPEWDQYISKVFGYRVKNLLLSIRTDKFKDLEDIILLDQISRHLDRHLESSFALKYNSIALGITHKIIKNNLNDWSPEQICFILMPLRHSKIKKNLELSLQYIHNLRQSTPDNNYFRRFYYANLKDLSKFITPQKQNHYPSKKFENNNILCSSSLYESCKHNKWLAELDSEQRLIKDFLKFKSNNFDKVTISLSGGVDSMVSSFILKKLGFEVSALMINYQNRKESSQEVDFVSWWCYQMGIPLYVTTIDYLCRTNDKERQFYENYTKDIRFESYRSLQRPVILGHNMDDCFENIFSNLKSKKSLANLTGMESISYQHGVTLLRPMLNIRKTSIFSFAHNYNIPYLFDSTPKWSQRGKYRDNLIPTIEKNEPLLLPSLLELSERLKKMSNHYYHLLEQNLKIEKIGPKKYCIQFTKCTDIDYWRYIFEKCLHLFKLKIPSLKSLKNLISILELNTNVIGKKIMLSKNYSGVFQDNNILIIMAF